VNNGTDTTPPRRLAAQLGVSRGVVSDTYDPLRVSAIMKLRSEGRAAIT
jgi:hypothetical protein